MYRNVHEGTLIAVDGPNGVGKSTLITNVQKALLENTERILVTKEPSAAHIGEFTRSIAEYISGNSLACLVAADRYNHLENEVIPHLKKGYVVLLDRYVLSSLILQQMDAVDVDFILGINDKIILPDLQFAIMANTDIIHNRLYERNALTRFEVGNRTEDELRYLHDGIEVLERLGVEVVKLSNNYDLDLEKNVSYMVGEIKKFFGK